LPWRSFFLQRRDLIVELVVGAQYVGLVGQL
jgi:hypothetical protein